MCSLTVFDAHWLLIARLRGDYEDEFLRYNYLLVRRENFMNRNTAKPPTIAPKN